MTTAPPDQTSPQQRRQLLAVVALIACLTAMRTIYAGVVELRTDEAYYWTWSKESVLSFLDHPPMIAWFIRFGTAIFGDTDLGVRFGGIVAMSCTQLLLADIVRRVTHDVRAIVVAILMPEAACQVGEARICAPLRSLCHRAQRTPFAVVEGDVGGGKETARLLEIAGAAAAESEVAGRIVGMAEMEAPAEVEQEAFSAGG